MMKQIVLIACVFLLLLSLCACGLGQNHLKEVEAWEVQNDSRIAVVDDRYSIITWGTKTINIEECLGQYYNNPLDDMFFLISDGKLYGMHSYNFTDEEYKQTIDIYALDLETQTLEVLYTEKYAPRDITDSLISSKVYYDNRNIVIYDGVRLTVFNVDTKVAEDRESTSFSYPQQAYTVECVKHEDGSINFQKIKIISDMEERVISVDYMAQRHEYIQQLMPIRQQKNLWETVDIFKRFFGSDFVIGDNIYLECTLLDKDGESNGAIFCYDYMNDTFTLVYLGFSGGLPDLYVIPVE